MYAGIVSAGTVVAAAEVADRLLGNEGNYKMFEHCECCSKQLCPFIKPKSRYVCGM